MFFKVIGRLGIRNAYLVKLDGFRMICFIAINILICPIIGMIHIIIVKLKIAIYFIFLMKSNLAILKLFQIFKFKRAHGLENFYYFNLISKSLFNF